MKSLHVNSYPASLEIEYPKDRDRLTVFFRIIWALPALALLIILVAVGGEATTTAREAGREMSKHGGGILAGLFAATALIILFRQRYPRWWFDFALELNRFAARVGAYLLLLTDQYPSTVDAQSVHLNVKYPDVQKDLNRWLPLIKWLLALPHYIMLLALGLIALAGTVIAWFSILFTGHYPKGIFDFVVGVSRWKLRVYAYAFMLATDEYPPFSLK